MSSDGFVPDNSNTTPSVVLNPNYILNHLVSFYYIQMPGLLPNPIKKRTSTSMMGGESMCFNSPPPPSDSNMHPRLRTTALH